MWVSKTTLSGGILVLYMYCIVFDIFTRLLHLL